MQYSFLIFMSYNRKDMFSRQSSEMSICVYFFQKAPTSNTLHEESS